METLDDDDSFETFEEFMRKMHLCSLISKKVF